MPVRARCPGCGKQVAGPDKAAGRKARCPDCGGVIEFRSEVTPGGPGSGAGPEGALASLAQSVAETTPAGAGAAEAAPAGGPAAAPTPSTAKTSVTTIGRMLARTSPYRSLRLMAAVCFAAGAGLAVLVFIAGLAMLVIAATAGRPWVGVAAFLGAIFLAGLVVLVAKVAGDLLRLAADVGDETRRSAQILEELRNHRRNGIA